MEKELRLSVDKGFISQLETELNYTKGVEVARDAFTILSWAVEELKKGRVILSADSEGENLKRLMMPSFANVKKHA